ncbi:flavin reductase family protein [Sphingopyxis sp. LARHCG72]
MDHSTELKAAMRRMPGAVSLVTAFHPSTNEPMGLAASAVIPASMAPPTMLVAINREASAHTAIALSRRFCVNLLQISHCDLVTLFSTPGSRSKRFEGDNWDLSGSAPILRDAAASISCDVFSNTECGTHDIFIGHVVSVVRCGRPEPLAWIEGNFARAVGLAG